MLKFMKSRVRFEYTKFYKDVSFSGIVNIVKFNTLITEETIIALNIY